ncbi:MAG TPA: hypothetical protein VH439_04315 [Gemmatimonadales bacterium]
MPAHALPGARRSASRRAPELAALIPANVAAVGDDLDAAVVVVDRAHPPAADAVTGHRIAGYARDRE